MHDGGDARQRGIGIQAETGGQHFEGDAAADMGEGGAVEIETERGLRALLRLVQPEEFRLAVDEAADQPGRGHAIDPEVLARGPGPPLKVGAGETANLARRRQRFAAGRRFERRKGRLRLALRLAGKIIDGDQRREFAAQARSALASPGIGGGHRPSRAA
jgi:hypothetical protein